MRSIGTTFSRKERKKVGSRNIAVTLTERSSSSRSITAGSCRSRFWSAEIVSTFSPSIRRRTRRRSEAGAYSRKSKP